MFKGLDIEKLVCYSDSLLSIDLIKGPTTRLHVYVVLIQDVNDSIEQSNAIVCHTLIEENHYVNFMVKFRASLNTNMSYHASPPEDLLHLMKWVQMEHFML